MNEGQTPQTPQSNDPKQKPVKQFRAGALSVSIWEKRGNDGSKFYSTTPSRCFKNKVEEWQYSDSYNRDDLGTIAQLLTLAFAWIVSQEAKNKDAQPS